MLIYITYPDQKTAKEITTKLLERKLIKCATTWPAQSYFYWENKVNETTEIISFIKTNQPWNKIESEIIKLHPYDTPCIIKLPAEFNRNYQEWLNGPVGI